MRAVVKKSLRILWLIASRGAVTLLIIVAIYASLGRYYADYVEPNREQILELLNQYSELHLQAGGLRAGWEGLSPVVYADNISISLRKGDPPKFIAQAAIAWVDVPATVRDRAIRLRSIDFTRAQIDTRPSRDSETEPGAESQTPQQRDLETIFASFIRPLRVLDHADYIRVANSHLLSRYGQHDIDFLLERKGDFRRITGQFTVEESPAVFVIETYGSLVDLDGLRAKAFTRLSDLQVDQWLPEKYVASTLRATTEFWLDWNLEQGLSVKGDLSVPSIDLSAINAKLVEPLTDLGFQFSLARTDVQSWQLDLNGLEFDWFGHYEFGAASVAIERGEETLIDAFIPRFAIAPVANMALQSSYLPASAAEILESLAPLGELHNLRLQIPLERPRQTQFSSAVVDVSVDSFRRSPSFKGISGVIMGSIDEGSLELASEGFSALFPGVYEHWLNYSAADGRLHWRLQEDHVELRSSVLRLKGEEGDINGYLGLIQPLKKDQGPTPSMDLLISLGKSHLHFVDRYLPQALDRNLRNWLDKALLGGDIESAAFAYRGSIAKGSSPMDRSLQLRFDISDTVLNFDDNWPNTSALEASVFVDEGRVAASVSEARIYNSTIHDVELLVGKGDDDILKLSIDGQFEAAGEDAVRLLQESPLRKALGSGIANWTGRGELGGRLQLDIPLVKSAGGTRASVDVNLRDVGLSLPSAQLFFNQLQGPLHYSSERGLQSEQLQGEFWGRPVLAKITSTEGKVSGRNDNIEIAFSGSSDMRTLEEWCRVAALGFADGDFNYNGSFKLGGGSPSLQINTDLKGVDIDLPAPLGKISAASWPSEVTFTLGQGDQKLGIQLADRASVDAQFEEFKLQGVQVHVLQEERYLPVMPGLYVGGELPEMELQEWLDVVNRYQGMAAAMPARENSAVDDVSSEDGAVEQVVEKTFPIGIRNLYIDKARAFGQEFEATNFDADQSGTGWRFQLANRTFKGNIQLFDDQRPMKIQLRRLQLSHWVEDEEDPGSPKEGEILDSTAPAEVASVEPVDGQADTAESEGEAAAQEEDVLAAVPEPERVDPLADLVLHDIPPMDIEIQSLRKGKEDFGTWSFLIRHTEQGLRFADIHVDLRGMQIAGVEAGTGARLDWFRDQGEMQSAFLGVARAGDLGEVLQLWGYEKVLDSKSAEHRIDLFWKGSPAMVDLEHSTGTIGIDVNDGRFSTPANPASSALKVANVFNFDLLVKRLSLDFSDMRSKGLAFDRIDGELAVIDGRLEIVNTIDIKGPSSSFVVSGLVDVEQQAVDLKLVTILPVTGNLPIWTAAAGGIPAALGVFVVSKLFKEQFDKLSSVVYEIKGPWNEPEIKFNKLFDIGSSKSKQPKRVDKPLPSESGSPEDAKPEQPDSDSS